MKPRLYLETSVISYHVARPSRDLVVAAHQQVTHEWWDTRLDLYAPHVSGLVLLEIAEGDPGAAEQRRQAVNDFPVLEVTPEDEDLARKYLAALPLPATALRDAVHLATSSLNDMEYLVTWNCKHIARGEIQAGLLRLNQSLGIPTPILVTPEELMGGD